MIEVELSLLCVASLIFTVCYEINTKEILFGIFAFVLWLVMGMYYLAAGDGTFWSLSLLWHGLGLIYLVRIMVQLVEMRNLRKEGEDEEI